MFRLSLTPLFDNPSNIYWKAQIVKLHYHLPTISSVLEPKYSSQLLWTHSLYEFLFALGTQLKQGAQFVIIMMAKTWIFVFMIMTLVWTPYSQVGVYQHVEGSFCLRVQDRGAEDGGSKLLRNVGNHLPDYCTLCQLRGQPKTGIMFVFES
jgi:hypothetical protein